MAVDEPTDSLANRRRTLDALFADTVVYSPVAPAIGPIGRPEVAGGAFAIPVLQSGATSLRPVDPPLSARQRTSSHTIHADISGERDADGRRLLRYDVRTGSDSVLRLEIVIDSRHLSSGSATDDGRAPDVMDLPEAARFLRISPSTLRALARSNRVPSACIGRLRRFRKAALMDWLRSREETTHIVADSVVRLHTVTGG
jgi:excisionase family DNA binding protein